jgi:hypothetical protein
VTMLISFPVSAYIIISQQHSALTEYRVNFALCHTIRGVSRSFRTGHLERELHMVQLSATRWSCIAILLVSLVSFAAITLCVDSERVFVVVYFVLDTPSHVKFPII